MTLIIKYGIESGCDFVSEYSLIFSAFSALWDTKLNFTKLTSSKHAAPLQYGEYDKFQERNFKRISSRANSTLDIRA